MDLCFPGRRALGEERRDGSLCAAGGCLALEVTEADVNEGEVEGHVGDHHLVEELHGQRDQLRHSLVTAAYRQAHQIICQCQWLLFESGQ